MILISFRGLAADDLAAAWIPQRSKRSCSGRVNETERSGEYRFHKLYMGDPDFNLTGVGSNMKS